jgi:hypothetical protein
MRRWQGQLAESAYRRGFTHAIKQLLEGSGLTKDQIEKLQYNKKVQDWRTGKKEHSLWVQELPPAITVLEARQLVAYLNSAFWDDQGDESNA